MARVIVICALLALFPNGLIAEPAAGPDPLNTEPELLRDPGGNSLDQGGETCSSATVISTLPYCDTGTTLGRANDYTPPCISGGGAPDVVYRYTPTSTTLISASLCGSSYNTVLHIWRGCPPNATLVCCSDDNAACAPNGCCPGVTLLSGQTYFFIVDGISGSAGNYSFQVIGGQTCPAPCDTCPYPSRDYEPSNNSCQNTLTPLSCPDTLCGTISTSTDQDYFSFQIPANLCGTVTIDIFGDDTPGRYPFGRGLDPIVYLISSDCATILASDDNGGTGNDSRLVSTCLPAGIYHIRVQGAGTPTPTTGPYILALSCQTCPCACEVTCPPGGISEGEPCPNYPDNYNGGCDSSPPVFRSISCGQTYCGTSYTTSTYRDRDWWSLQLTERDTIWWCVQAEFPVEFAIERPGANGCLDRDTLAWGTAPACSMRCIGACLDPGAYAVYVAPIAGAIVPCSNYVARLNCTVCTTPDTCDYQSRDFESQNNSCGTPNPAVFCTDTLCGAINYLGDTDWYRLDMTATPCGEVTLDVFGNDTPGQYPFGHGLNPIVRLYRNDCSTLIGMDDNGGVGNDSRYVSPCLDPGTYYIQVDATGTVAPTTGPYVLAIHCASCSCPPDTCIVSCPPGGIPEGEPCPNVPDYFNSGCDSPQHAFRVIECNTTICGTASAGELTGPDMDWYQYATPWTDTVFWCVRAEFPVEIALMAEGPGNPCIGLDTLACGRAEACSTVCVGACVPPGRYMLYVIPVVPGVMPCKPYVASLYCTICTPALPEAPDSVVISPYPFPDINLYWPPVPGTDEYRVYRDVIPQVPILSSNYIGTTADTFYTDPGVQSTSAAKYFYTVVSHRHRTCTP